MPVTIIAGIDWMMQNILKCFPVRAMPLQLASVGPEMGPNRQSNSCWTRNAAARASASLAIELVEDKPHHLFLARRVQGPSHGGVRRPHSRSVGS